MATLTQRRLVYSLEYNSLAFMSRLLGVSTYFVKLYRDDLRVIPKEFNNLIRNNYQTTVYKNLRDSGFSSVQAKRFSWYIPETVREVNNTFNSLLDELTQGAVIKHMAVYESILTPAEQSILEQNMRSSIVEGIQKSRNVYEDWLDYIT